MGARSYFNRQEMEDANAISSKIGDFGVLSRDTARMPRRHLSQTRSFSALVESPLDIATRALARFDLGTLRRFAAATARVHAHLPSSTRATIIENLARCFPDAGPSERRRQLVDTLRHVHFLAVETGICWHYSHAKALRLIHSFAGLELLRGDEPLIVLQPHFGNWEFLTIAIQRERPVAALYAPNKVGAIDAALFRARTSWGAAMYPTNAQGLRRLRRSLDHGSAVMLLPDQVPPPNAGIDVPFFGVPARTMTFAHQLMQHAHARVVFGWIERSPSGFAAHFEAAPTAIYSDDAETSVTAMNGAIETIVRRDPAQYQWGYKRFKMPRDKRAARYTPRH